MEDLVVDAGIREEDGLVVRLRERAGELAQLATLKVLDDATIAFADFTGNRQYITQRNLEENPKAQLLLVDYSTRRRIKIWGEARIVEGDAELTTRLMPEGYEARPEQAIVFTVKAWDANCPRHIPQLLPAADVATALADRDRRIAALEAEVARLRAIEPTCDEMNDRK